MTSGVLLAIALILVIVLLLVNSISNDVDRNESTCRVC